LFTAAAATERLRLAVGVVVAAYRPAPVVAKLAATLDCLSGGRMILGLAQGWLEEEFRALGVRYQDRLSRLLETIEVCRLLWTHPQPSFEGTHFSFGPSHFEPKPAQGRIPIVMGGHADGALRRAGMLGDGWFGSRLRPEELPRMRAIIDEGRADAGRLNEPFTIYTSRLLTEERANDAHLEIPITDPPRIREVLHEYAAAGADVVMIDMKDHRSEKLLRAVDAVGTLGL
jgi:probable F420-dependent oxidoreductase